MNERQGKRILFVGMPDMAIICFDKLKAYGANIVAAIPPHPSHSTCGAFSNFVRSRGVPVIRFDSLYDKEFLETIKSFEPYVAVVCSFDRLIPNQMLEIPKMGFINCHPSLLPDYRGANPYYHVIANNEKYTGVTLHYMNEKFDEGDIIFQEKIEIDSAETMGTLFNRLNFLTADMLVKTVRMIDEDIPLPRFPQPKGEFLKAENVPDENYIDWSMTAPEIERLIRASNPFLAQTTFYKGVFMKIFTCDFDETPPMFEPGTICMAGARYGITTGKGIIYPKSIRIGTYLICDWEEFIERFRPNVGEQLTS